MDKIECRRRDQHGSDVRVVAEIGPDNAKLDVTMNGRRSTHAVPRARLSGMLLRDVTVPPVAFDHRAGGEPVGYEITFSAELTQSSFRWIGDAPAGWDAIATAADALLAVARESAEAKSVT